MNIRSTTLFIFLAINFATKSAFAADCVSFNPMKDEGPKFVFSHCSAEQVERCKQLEKVRSGAFAKARGSLPYACHCLDSDFFKDQPKYCPESIDKAIDLYTKREPSQGDELDEERGPASIVENTDIDPNSSERENPRIGASEE